MDWDPLNLRNYGQATYKKLMTLLVSCVVSLALALIVFIVASLGRDEVTETSINVTKK
jgi:hypothetical protein